MLRVTIFNASMSAHLSQLFAGLYDLQAAGLLEMHFRTTSERGCFAHLLSTELADEWQTRRVCFDMSDGAFIDQRALEQADVYFKRSFANAELCKLPMHARTKVHPFGLNYACTTDAQLRSITYAKQLLAHELTDAASRNGRLRSMRRLIGHPVRWFNGQMLEVTASSPLQYSAFEASADAHAKRAVIFLTRLWCTDERPGPESDRRRELNEARVAVIKTLRKRFPDRFLGGVERDRYSETHYPDCIIDNDTVKTNYIELMKGHLIGVATTGLHGSIGWKLAEYVAASRCIVSQPILNEGTTGLTPGKHYLEFDTADACASACERLLDDPALAREMRRNNEDYYEHELKPPVLMMKRLHTAMAV